MTNKEKQIEKEALRARNLKIKDKFENNNMGDFQNLYPLPLGVSKEQDELMERYEYLYQKKSRQVYEDSVAGGGLPKSKKEELHQAERRGGRTSQLGDHGNKEPKAQASKQTTPQRGQHTGVQSSVPSPSKYGKAGDVEAAAQAHNASSPRKSSSPTRKAVELLEHSLSGEVAALRRNDEAQDSKLAIEDQLYQ